MACATWQNVGIPDFEKTYGRGSRFAIAAPGGSARDRPAGHVGATSAMYIYIYSVTCTCAQVSCWQKQARRPRGSVQICIALRVWTRIYKFDHSRFWLMYSICVRVSPYIYRIKYYIYMCVYIYRNLLIYASWDPWWHVGTKA